MGVISARINDEDEKVLKEARINLSKLVREAAHDQARLLRQKRALERLGANAVDVDSRSEDIVREGRDD